MPVPVPIWLPDACVPRSEVLEGRLTDSELALSLPKVVWGGAKAPYDKPGTFFSATHLTPNMSTIFDMVMGRLTGKRTEVNPILVLDVGFGGGKTHTLVMLYYAAKFGLDVTGNFGKFTESTKVVALSGEEYGELGVERKDVQVKTLWGDLFWQLGKYETFKRLDEQQKIPSLKDIEDAIGDSPTLILLDELPTYLKLARVSETTLEVDQFFIDKVVLFLQRLVAAVSAKSRSCLVVAIAEDVYQAEALQAKRAIQDAETKGMEEAKAHLGRQENILVPATEADMSEILKKRLFEKIDKRAASKAREAYLRLYSNSQVDDSLKGEEYADLIEKSYPFHPELLRVLYERVATIDEFNRTRGALRLLGRTVRRIWREKENDAFLIHPFHIDLADPEIVNELTERIREPKLRNAVESDVWNTLGNAKAQELDEQSISHWGAPLVRRASNTIYLYSLATGKEGSRGLRNSLLASLCATPDRPDNLLRYRDVVFPLLAEQFQYIDRIGERFVFVKEPTPARVIELAARDVSEDEATKFIKETLTEMFGSDPDWVHPEFFPASPAEIPDEPWVRVAVMNPNLYSISKGLVTDDMSKFILYRDEQGRKGRAYTNSTFLLVASADRLPLLANAAKKAIAAKLVGANLVRYNIPKERKSDVEEHLARHNKSMSDYVRAAFSNLVYLDKGGVETTRLDASGYGSAKSSRAVIANHLIKGLDRVIDQPLSPADYIIPYVWPKDRSSISTLALYDRLYAVPGLRIPATRDIFLKTVEKGLLDGIWVLKTKEESFKGNAPRHIPLTETDELLTPQEAERLKLFEAKKGEVEKWKSKGGKAVQVEQLVDTITFDRSKLRTLISDLEVKMKSRKFNSIQRITLKLAGNPLHFYAVKDFITKVGADKNLKIVVEGSIEKYAAPSYHFSFAADKEQLQTEAGKSVFEVGPKLKLADITELSLRLDWADYASVNDAKKALTSLEESSVEPLMAALEAVVARTERGTK